MKIMDIQQSFKTWIRGPRYGHNQSKNAPMGNKNLCSSGAMQKNLDKTKTGKTCSS